MMKTSSRSLYRSTDFLPHMRNSPKGWKHYPLLSFSTTDYLARYPRRELVSCFSKIESVDALNRQTSMLMYRCPPTNHAVKLKLICEFLIVTRSRSPNSFPVVSETRKAGRL